MTRGVMAALAFVFLAGFFGLTAYAAFKDGFTVFTVISLLVIGLMAVGIFGALSAPSDDD